MEDQGKAWRDHSIPQFFRWISAHHQPHTINYCDHRETLYASHPTLGTITQSHLPTNTTRLLIPRGIIREPTSMCYVSAVPRPHVDADDDESDDLYFADTKGCRIWRIRLGDDLYADTPEPLYQSYPSPYAQLHLRSLADYQRDDASPEARMARKDEGRHVRGVAVARTRQKLFWCQGSCVMYCNLEPTSRADARDDLMILAEAPEFERIEQMWVDSKERWLCLRDPVTAEERRLFLGGIDPFENDSGMYEEAVTDEVETPHERQLQLASERLMPRMD